jgi:GDPmannose 4,6-dehydratase
MVKKALILGITGQDGSYLAELLLEKGYEVHGLWRRASTDNTVNIRHIKDRITLHPGDMGDPLSIFRHIQDIRPDEIYNNADQDNIRWSHDTVSYNCDITGAAVGRTLESIRLIDKDIRFFQPISATVFYTAHHPQNEETPLNPLSPYSCAKAFALHLVRYYRQAHGMFVATAIFFNHDSPRRTEQYLLPEICRGAVCIKNGVEDKLSIGNLDQVVDIGYAPEYVEASWNILQLGTPDDFVISSGQPKTIRQIVDHVFGRFGLNYQEKVTLNQAFATCTLPFIGDSRKASHTFGFNPKLSVFDVADLITEKYIPHGDRHNSL